MKPKKAVSILCFLLLALIIVGCSRPVQREPVPPASEPAQQEQIPSATAPTGYYEGPIIDNHAHPIPPWVGDQNAYYDGLVARMDKIGVIKMAMHRNAEWTRGYTSFSSEHDEWVLAAHERHPDRIIPYLGGFDPREPDAVSYVREQLQTGRWKGIGELDLRNRNSKTKIAANSPVMMGIYRVAAEFGVPVTIHYEFDYGVHPPQSEQELEDALEKNPDTTIIYAHSPPVHLMKKHPNLWAEISLFEPNASELLRNIYESERGLLDRIVLCVADVQAPDFMQRFPFTDRTFTYEELVDLARQKLGELPQEFAQKVAYENLAGLLGITVPAITVSPAPQEVPSQPTPKPTPSKYPAPSTYYRMDNTHEVAVRPDGKQLYVYGVESSIILIVDIDSPDYPVVGRIELPGRVAGGTPYISFSNDGKRAYMCRAIQREYEGTRYKGESLAKIIVIDTEKKAIVSEVEVPEPLLPAIGSVIPSADGRQLYFTALDPSSHETGIGRLDMDNETLVDFLPLESVNFITLSNDGKHIYATQGLKAFGPSKDLFTVIDAGSLEVVSSLPVGSGPQYVAITPDGQKAYVANQGSNDVSVIDLKTLAVTKNVDVGPEPRAIAITPDGKKAYVGLPGSATGMRGYGPGKMVAVLDVETDALLGTIEVDLEPMSVAMDPDGTKVYVSDGNANGLNPAEVHIIDAVNDAYLRPIILRRAASYTPTAIDVTPDGQMLFVVSEATDNLLVISTEGGEIIAKLNIRARGVKVSADGSRVYAYTPEKLLVIDTETLEIIKSVDVSGIYPEFYGDQEAFKIVLTTNEDTAYLLGKGAEVIVVDLVKGKVTDTIPFAEQPIEHSRGLALTPDETKLLVSDYHSRTVAVIDTSTRAVIARLPVANLPSEIEISQDGKRAYVLQQHTTTLMTIINLESLSILESIQFPAHIAASLDFELSADGRYAYIACFDPNFIMVYDLGEEKAVEVIDVGLDPFNMTGTSDGQFIYITNFTTDDISVVDTLTNRMTRTIKLE